MKKRTTMLNWPRLKFVPPPQGKRAASFWNIGSPILSSF